MSRVNSFPRQKLCSLIDEYDSNLYKDKKRCKGFLLDYCGEYKQEIFLLTKAVEQKVPEELINYKSEAKNSFQSLILNLKTFFYSKFSLDKIT